MEQPQNYGQQPQYSTHPQNFQQIPPGQPIQYAQPAQYVQYAQQPGMPIEQQPPSAPLGTAAPLPPPSKYALLELLPMFPLESAEAERQRQKTIAQSEWFASRVQAEPKKTPMDRVGLAIIEASGGGLLNVRKIDNNAMKLQAGMGQMLASDVHFMAITRWTLPPESSQGGEPLLVDILEHGATLFISNVVFYVKATQDVKLIFRNKHTGKVKKGGMYSKKLNSKPVEQVALIGDDKKEIPLEVVLRLQRPISPIEAAELTKGFERTWSIPSPV